MKYILYILSMYFTLLTVMPCMPDSDDCSTLATVEEYPEAVEKYVSWIAHTHDTKGEEACSPFCFCNLCRTAIASLEFPEFTFINFYTSPLMRQAPGMSISKTGKIDKPPKLIS